MLLWLSCWPPGRSLSAQVLYSPMASAIRPQSSMTTEDITTRRATRRSKCRARHGGLGHLFRIPSLSLRLPCLSRSRRRRIELRTGAQQLLEDEELFRLRRGCRQRPQERQHGAGGVMPPFGTNRNVMCYIGDIFVYLRARANDAVPRGRPQKHEDKPEAATQAENSCLGHKS